MATNFPTSVDNFTNPTANDSLNIPSHSLQHANANDAIEAIEGYLLTGLGKNGLVPLISETISASSGISFSNFISSSYSHYKLIFRLTGSTVGSYVGIRARENTTDYSGNTYYSATWGATAGSATTFIGVGNPNTLGFTARLNTTFDLYSYDFSTTGTQAQFTGTGWDSYNFGASFSGVAVHNMTNMTGLTIYPTAGTITGEIQIFGYRKP